MFSPRPSNFQHFEKCQSVPKKNQALRSNLFEADVDVCDGPGAVIGKVSRDEDVLPWGVATLVDLGPENDGPRCTAQAAYCLLRLLTGTELKYQHTQSTHIRIIIVGFTLNN